MSNPLPRYNGIEGLTPRDPIGAVVTVGTKGPSGNPTETDRFFFKVADSTKVGEHLVKPLHPGFATFNAADVSKRQTIYGNLVHATRDEAFQYALSARVLGKGWPHFPGAHPNKVPICTGNGIRATRLYGIGADGAEDWREIDCPNSLCTFRQGLRKPCGASMRFLFQVRWKAGVSLPSPLTLLLSNSWNSAARFLGFFEYIEKQAREFGLKTFSFYGLPLSITLAQKTKASLQARFPVLSISTDFPNDMNLQDFFGHQREKVRAFGGTGTLLALPAKLTDPEQNDPAKVALDFAEIEPGTPLAGKPGNLEPPAETFDAEVVPDPPAAEDNDGRLSADARRRILAAAEIKGLTEPQVESIAGGHLYDAPASLELQILRDINAYKPTAKRGR